MIDPHAVLLSTLAGMATSLGAVPVFFMKRVSHRTKDTLVGLSAGLMLSVTALNLVPKALGQNQENILQVIVGIALGAITLFVADMALPHIHGVLIPEKPLTKGMKATLMMIAAITIHNFPEGFATGTAYAGGITRFGNTVALGIALQNIPEGFVVALPLRSQGYSTKTSFIGGVLSGLVEPICSVTALIVVGLFHVLLPYALAFAGGAMLYVIFDEMVPESHSHGFERESTAGFMIGFLLMTILNYVGSAIFA